jgi:hypothetical protein
VPFGKQAQSLSLGDCGWCPLRLLTFAVMARSRQR